VCTAGVDVDMFHISDTVMTLAALAPLADGPTTIRNIANIRIKVGATAPVGGVGTSRTEKRQFSCTNRH
jgi:hypothetical protein